MGMENWGNLADPFPEWRMENNEALNETLEEVAA
jgi:hypothetical protein